MTKLFKYTISVLLCISVLLPLIPFAPASAYIYCDGFTTIGDVTIPFAEYMPGSFFTKNGKACTCHDDASINCVASGEHCNCLRYTTINGVSVDLYAVQCIGFARYTFYRLFGFLDVDWNSSLFYNAGTINGGNVTPENVKALIQALKPGAHIRFKLAYTEHSIILLNQNEEGFTVYQANAGGNGIESRPCVISTRTYTWEQFANTAYRGIVFAHMPYNYPGEPIVSEDPYGDEIITGTYITTDNLNLRSAPSTDSQAYKVIPNGTFLNVKEVSGGWGKTEYSGYEGWVYMQYLTLLDVLTPKEESGLSFLHGYVFGINPGTTPLSLGGAFLNDQINYSCGGGEYIGTGVYIDSVVGGYPVTRGEVVVYGDVNGDGIISVADCVTLKNALTGAEKLVGAFAIAADVNGTGNISTADYKSLRLALSLGKDITPPPIIIPPKDTDEEEL